MDAGRAPRSPPFYLKTDHKISHEKSACPPRPRKRRTFRGLGMSVSWTCSNKSMNRTLSSAGPSPLHQLLVTSCSFQLKPSVLLLPDYLVFMSKVWKLPALVPSSRLHSLMKAPTGMEKFNKTLVLFS